MSYHEIVKDYLEPIVEDLAGTVLQFNFSPESPDSISIITDYSDNVVRRFVTGDIEKAYGFSIVIVKEYSTESDDLNMEAMEFADSFMEALNQKNREKDFPDFGENVEIIEIESLQNMANLALVNEEEGLARYQLQGRIRYYEESSD